MLDTVFHVIKLFRSPEIGRVRIGIWRLTLALEGIDAWKVILPDGRELAPPPDYPWLALIPPNAETHFRMGEARRNWAMSFETAGLDYEAREGRIRLRSGQDWLSVPFLTAVPARRREALVALFEAMNAGWREGTPDGLFRARLALASVMAGMLDLASEPAKASPEEKFRDAIDRDESCRHNLADLARECGYSANHLRLLFERRFHLSPVQYRNRRRLQTAMELISGTRQSLPEIAGQTGFRHLSHLSAAFRSHYGITLREALRRYRRQGNSG
jgi:AraC-like DNA-binding protein